MAVVIYHKNCADGTCAAAVAKLSLSKDVMVEHQFIPANYGDSLLQLLASVNRAIVGIELYILDFSFKPGEIKELLKVNDYLFNKIVILDHHASAKDNFAIPADFFAGFKTNVNWTFDMNFSGAMLAWLFFFPTMSVVPGVINYVQDRDLWQWKLPQSKEINACLQILDKDNLEPWISLIKQTMFGLNSQTRDTLVSEGGAILRTQEFYIAKACENAKIIDSGRMAGTFPVGNYAIVNAANFQSEIGNKLLENIPALNCAMIFYVDVWESKAQFSVRSTNGSAVGIAKAFNGGGHPNAAGFRVEIEALKGFL